MSLNQLGLGFVFSAKDLASGVMRRLDGDFKKLEGTTDKAAQSMKAGLTKVAVGLGAVAAGAKGLDILGQTTEGAIKFGKQIAEVSTLVDEAAFSTEDMRKITTNMAETFGIDAFEQAPALYQAISSGATDAASATDLLDSANKFAIGGVTSLAASVDVLSSSVNTYGKENLSTADAADTMFVAIRAGKTTADELAQSLGRVTPTAKSMGISFQEVNAAIAATTAQGIRTRESVTGMKAAIANIIKPTKDAEKEAKRLGIAFDAESLKAQGLAGFLDSVTESANFNDQSLSKLFSSVEGLNFITALTSDNSAKFNDVLGQMDQRTGAATQAFDKMNDSVAQQEARIDALKKNISLTIGEALLPLREAIINSVGKALELFRKLPKPVQKGVAIFIALSSAVLLVAGSIITLAGAMQVLGAAGLKALAPFLPFLLPIIAVIGAITLAVFLLKKAWESNFLNIRTNTLAVFNAIIAIWEFARDLMVSVIEKVVQRWNFMVSIFRTIGDAVSSAFAAVAEKLEPVIEKIEQAIGLAKDLVGFVDDVSSAIVGSDTGGVGFSGDPSNFPPDVRRKLVAAGKLDKSFLPKEDFGRAAGGASPGGDPRVGSGPQKVNVQQDVKLTVELDGEVLARSSKRINADDANRRSR